ncbi:hypothetical protein ACP3V3_02125 [Vibrio sp. PNB22_3_1]
MSMKSYILMSIFTLLLAGCSVLGVQEIKENQLKAGAEIDRISDTSHFGKVITMPRPPMKVNRIETDPLPAWMDRKIDVVIEQLPLSIVLREMLGTKIQFQYGHGVDPALPVSLYFEGSVEEALNMLSVSVDYGFKAVDDKLFISTTETKTFFIPAVSGEVSYQIGSSSSGDGQFTNIKADKFNPTKNIIDGITTLLTTINADGKSELLGVVKEIPVMSSIVVKTTPRLMRSVETYIEESIKELKRYVELEVQVVEFIADDGVEIGANIDALIKSGSDSYGLNVVSPTLGQVVDVGLGVTLGESSFNGNFEGTKGLLTYLKTKGRVTVKTYQRVRASNFQAQEFDLGEMESYISEVETTPIENTDRMSVTINKGEVRDGVKLLVMPTIQDDSVYLRMTGTLEKLLGFKDTEISGIQTRDVRMREAFFNTSGRYEYNEDIVVTHMRQVATTSDDSSFAEVKSGVAGSERIVDTLIVVTPRRVVSNY